MIEKMNTGLYAQTGFAAPQKPAGRILTMVPSDRMAGGIPVWSAPHSAQQQVQQGLSAAQVGSSASFQDTLAYNNAHLEGAAEDQEFGFGDLIDMINPLHHIPLVGHVYREITGDEIKPIGKIIGGGVFGGPAGAAVGLVDAAVTEETGQDIAGNAVALAFDGKAPEMKRTGHNDHPQKRLNDALQPEAHDLPVNLLAFADTGAHSEVIMGRVVIERVTPDQQIAAPSYNAHDWKIAAQLAAAPAHEPVARIASSKIVQYSYNG